MTRYLRILSLAITATAVNGSHAQEQAQASPSAVLSGFGSDAAMKSFGEKVRRLVRSNLVWIGPADNSTRTVIQVQCATDGKLLSATIYRASGNPAWDAAALSAVQHSDPMPSDDYGNTLIHFKITVMPN
ncbi:energy transducer TonB [Paraburkholderia azotifigens]|uniref:energy transducer TonB n=1 Tax=Paraburkholderia azotifigens TaxID=2057004 RepID=UPI00317ADB7E